MPVSEAKKKANARWNASKDNIMIRPDKEDGAAIREAADKAAQSLQQYILQAAHERMERDCDGKTSTSPKNAAGQPAGVGGISLPSRVLETAQRASEAVGETVPQFVERAVETQAKRDEVSLRMGLNPATGEKLNQSGEGGADHE